MIFLDLNIFLASISTAKLGLTADVAELADAPDLGSGIARCMGSSPFVRTIFNGMFFKKR